MEHISSPLDVIQRLFEQNYKVKDDWGVTAYFTELERNGSLEAVPALTRETLSSLPPNSLVRCRMMVQDCFDPEYFGGIIEELDEATSETRLRHSKYQDFVPFEEGKTWKDLATMDRMVYYCVPVPAETQWHKRFNKEKEEKARAQVLGVFTGLARAKRQREDVEMAEPEAEAEKVNNAINDSKRSKVEIQDCEVEDDGGREKKDTSTFPDLNFPLPNSDGIPVLLKIYPTSDTEGDDGILSNLKMNTLIEVIGILSAANPELSEKIERAEDDFFDTPDERMVRQPPSSLVPRVHAILVRHMKDEHPFHFPNPALELEQRISAMREIRPYLLNFLTNILGGDKLAAEYLLMNLISRIYSRSSSIALGAFPLNFRNFAVPDRGEYMHKVISSLLPKSHLLHLTPELVNSPGFRVSPKKDYNQNRLVSGQLQLSCGTHIVIDESPSLSQPGANIQPQGVSKLETISKLVSAQTVLYDFEYYQTEFPTDFPLLILSTHGSFLAQDSTVNCELPVKFNSLLSAQELEEYINRAESEGALAKFREYLAFCSALISHFLPLENDLITMIQTDFVESRSRSKQIHSNDLHLWLTFVRYLAISYGELTVSNQRWTEMKDREGDRIARLVAMNIRV